MSGYVTDTPYTWGFYGELSPVYLNFISALNGQRPRPLDDGFTYCELGCGNGVSVNILAELFPQGQFTGIDLMGEHIEAAAGIAGDAGLNNAVFQELDFNDLTEADLPPFDFITLHGVYSWIDPDAREALRAFLKSNLKDGGIAYVSYDTLPGWAAIAPLRDLVLDHTKDTAGDTRTKAQAGLDFLQFLKDNKAGYFADNPPAAAFVDEIAKHDMTYVAHEFFGEAVKPYYFHQVATEMRSAGLNYSGSAIPHLNFVDLAAPAEFHDLLKKSATRIEFETHGDFIRNQRFRKDVFVKGGKNLAEAEQADILMDTPFGLACALDQFNRTVMFGDVELNYAADLFGNVLEHLAAGAKRGRDLAEMDDLKSYGPELVMDAIRFLTAGGQVLPFAAKTTAPGEAALTADRYELIGEVNLSHLKKRLLTQPAIGLAGGSAGIGIEVAMADALFALCSVESNRDGVADWAFNRLLESGREMVVEGGNEAQALAEAVDKFRASRLAKFLELGILAPAS